ncbi:MAG: FKBP-type peptidyl-prolyl cis-trans isomerase, partial [Treponema sp.]|nr:FKBP-type peptidyl-prolyl cis-trans isomerase [Treponema sp.]
RARVSYAFGMAIGINFNLTAFDIEFDYHAFAEGLRAVIEGHPQLTEEEALEIIEVAFQSAMERRFAQYRRTEQEFLLVNSQRPEVRETESGLQYIIIEYTEGEKPNADSVVRVHYQGTFTDGTLFDRSDEPDGTYIPLALVIEGWTEGLMLMSPGSHFQFYIPSNLAYGSDGIHGIIPPYATLIFSVELLEIVEDEDSDFWDYD